MCRSQGEIPQLLKLVVTVFSLSCITSIANAALRLQTDPRAIEVIQAKLTKLPLSFEANLGQADSQTQFLSRVPGMTLRVKPGEMTVTLNSIGKGGQGKSQTAAVSMKLVNANRDGALVGEMEQPGKSNYLVGKNPKHWKTNIAHFARVRQAGVYPGIDLVYHGDHSSLEYDFVVAPGGDPAHIRLEFTGVTAVTVSDNGELRLKFTSGELIQRRPVVYQEIDGVRRVIESGYQKVGRRNVIFRLAAYDSSKPLVIDPVVAYATYLGGVGADYASGVAVDNAGIAYITGHTSSTDFPTTPGALKQTTASDIAFVAKIDTVNNALVYSTYLGGGLQDSASDIAIDSFGNAYIVGSTQSIDFPIVDGFQIDHSAVTSLQGGQSDAFIAKLNSTGTALLYSSYLGGNANDFGNSIAIDSSGVAVIVGNTFSSDFPTFNAAQPAKGDTAGNFTSDAFVAKIDTINKTRSYVTYFGGARNDAGNDVTVDSSGNVYLTGNSNSDEIPTPGAFQTIPLGAMSAYVAKLGASGVRIYSTFVASPSVSSGSSIAVDATGNAVVVGRSNSPLPGGLMLPQGASSNFFFEGLFVAKVNAQGSALVQSAWIPNAQDVQGMALAPDGAVYVTGLSTASGILVTPSETLPAGNRYVIKINATATGIGFGYNSGIGDSIQPFTNALAIDGARNVYVTGQTLSTGIPITAGAIQTSPNGNTDTFLLKLTDNSVATRTSLTVVPLPTRAGQPTNLTATVTAATGGNVRFSSNTAVLGIAQLTGGIATLATSIPTAGNTAITATFEGFGEFETSTSEPLQIALIKADATISLRLSTDEVDDGDTFTASATVRGANPTGFVKFRANDDDIATVGINPDGTASALLGARGFGSLRVQAEYSGDANNETANSNEETVTVGSLGGIFGGGGGCTIGSDSRFEPVLLLSLILSFAAIGWRRSLFRRK